jgi:hypothetical protein
MTFAKAEDIDELSDVQVINQTISLIRGLSKISNHFREVPAEYVREIYRKLVEALDEADDMESFGAEGWRYNIE